MRETLAELQTRAAKADLRIEIEFEATTGEACSDGEAQEWGSYSVRFIPMDNHSVDAPIGWGGTELNFEPNYEIVEFTWDGDDINIDALTQSLRVEHDYLGPLPTKVSELVAAADIPHINGVPLSLLEEYENSESPPESEAPSFAAFDKCKPGDIE